MFGAPAAYAVPVFDIPVAAPSAESVLDEAGAGLLAAPSDPPGQAEEPAAPGLIPEPSNWTMLLVGAGVLLLPRRRRTDNAVR